MLKLGRWLLWPVRAAIFAAFLVLAVAAFVAFTLGECLGRLTSEAPP